jgi:hypothetical protein
LGGSSILLLTGALTFVLMTIHLTTALSNGRRMVKLKQMALGYANGKEREAWLFQYNDI